RFALAGEAHLRAVLDARGQLQIDRRAVGKRDPLILACRRVDERHFEPVTDIGALARWRSARGCAARRAAAHSSAASEQSLEQVAQVHAFAVAEALEVLGAVIALRAAPRAAKPAA